MLKRIRFAPDGAAGWREALVAGADAPPDVRPLRIAVCTSLPELLPDPRHDVIGLEWFTDVEHVGRFDEWSAPDAGTVVVAEERVLRGADWLERRWRDGDVRLKHMAMARRAAHLSQAEFSKRWTTHAGTLGPAAIPDEVRGCAYVQNHPLAPVEGEWAYDAVNEVYFDDVEGLRRRIAYFEATLADGTEHDLFGEHWLLAAREEVLFTS